MKYTKYSCDFSPSSGEKFARQSARFDLIRCSLTETEKERPLEIVTTGKAPARTILRANVLLASDRNNKTYMIVAKIAEAYHTTPTTIEKIRAMYENEGLERVLRACLKSSK